MRDLNSLIVFNSYVYDVESALAFSNYLKDLAIRVVEFYVFALKWIIGNLANAV